MHNSAHELNDKNEHLCDSFHIVFRISNFGKFVDKLKNHIFLDIHMRFYSPFCTFKAFCYGLVAPTLPELQRIAHVGSGEISWLATARSLGQLIGSLLGKCR